MIPKKLRENRHLFSVLSNSKPRLRKAIHKHHIDDKFINLLSELCLSLTEGSTAKSSQITDKKKIIHLSILSVAKIRMDFKRKRLVEVDGSFFTVTTNNNGTCKQYFIKKNG